MDAVPLSFAVNVLLKEGTASVSPGRTPQGMRSARAWPPDAALALKAFHWAAPLVRKASSPGWFLRGKSPSERIGSRGFLPQSVRNRCKSIPALRIRREACMPKTDFLVPLPLFSGREEICPETLSSSDGVALGPKAASRLKRLDPTANVTMIDENINIRSAAAASPTMFPAKSIRWMPCAPRPTGPCAPPSISSIRACIP